MFITEEQALRRFPELRELVTLREAGWTFRPIADQNKGLAGIVGSYSQRRFIDALWIWDAVTMVGVRILDQDYGGGTVWMKDSGTLSEIVHELLALPDPDHRQAPRLVKFWPSTLWTPS